MKLLLWALGAAAAATGNSTTHAGFFLPQNWPKPKFLSNLYIFPYYLFILIGSHFRMVSHLSITEFGLRTHYLWLIHISQNLGIFCNFCASQQIVFHSLVEYVLNSHHLPPLWNRRSQRVAKTSGSRIKLVDGQSTATSSLAAVGLFWRNF